MDFMKVPAAVFSPSACTICGSSSCAQGFVDCGTDLSHKGALTGRVYVCASCSVQLGIACGLTDERAVAELRAVLEVERGETARLTGELAQAKGDGTWSFTPTMPADPDLSCPDCGAPKTAKAKRCKPCANKIPAAQS